MCKKYHSCIKDFPGKPFTLLIIFRLLKIASWVFNLNAYAVKLIVSSIFEEVSVKRAAFDMGFGLFMATNIEGLSSYNTDIKSLR